MRALATSWFIATAVTLPAQNAHGFLEAEACALCHAASPVATAMWSATGEDVSPHGLWQATMMANSFRDPYWRAQVSKEVAAAPERRAEIEALCVTCHAPAAHHFARLAEQPSPSIAECETDSLARDGVTCTVCHRARGEPFGKPESFSGGLDIRDERLIFGPYEQPFFQPMRMHTGMTATHGPHIRDAGLCGSCHTLFTSHVAGAAPFPEQSPYLEWRNSEFATDGATPRTCQECHMPDQGPTRIAHNPMGTDFNIPARAPYRGHAFVGGNAFMLELLADNAEELGVQAPAEAFARLARATRRQLAHGTASLAVEALRADGDALEFAVRVVNETGHKLPTAYPSRRVWLQVQVRAGNETLFESGDYDIDGEIHGLTDARANPHHDLIDDPSEVQVYEAVPVDVDGAPTTYLTRMVKMGKDNRILPRGWRDDGPFASDTRPAGVGNDADFAAGSDLVHYRVALPARARGRAVVVALLHYQSVPPPWVDPLRSVDTEEAKRFVRMYDRASKRPETLAVAVARVP